MPLALFSFCGFPCILDGACCNSSSDTPRYVSAPGGTRCAGLSHHEHMALLVAAAWDGHYVRQDKWILGAETNAEDAYMWVDARGTHMLMHTQARQRKM